MLVRYCIVYIVTIFSSSFINAQGTTPSLVGRWPNGEWQNSSNSHHGPLHATFSQVNDSQYRVNFAGRFAKVIPFRYTVVLNVTGTSGDGTTYLSGTSHIPIFGTFQYDAVATPTGIETSYQSRKFTGKFLLSR